MGQKYDLNFRLQEASKSCTVRISIRHLSQVLSVFYTYQDTHCHFFPINIRNVPICALYRLARCSHSTRNVLIKAPSFDNTFYISCRQRWNMVLNVLNQIKTAKNKKQNRKQGNYYSIKKIGEKKSKLHTEQKL